MKLNDCWHARVCCLFATALLSLPWSVAVAQVAVDTRVESDHIALVFEAEDSDSRDDRWVLTEPGTPQQENDPDPNHSDQAVGQTYLELLPDIRVTHGDPFGPPDAFWGVAGTGPRAVYGIDFPEPGRYYVHLRAFSTGTEDNGIHVGLDGDFPSSGRQLQFCSAGRGWSWSGRQRESGGRGACGAPKTIWVTVEQPGRHEFMISAREDGFELDRIMLIKDLSNNTRVCSPEQADSIRCVDGSIENVDDLVDLEVSLIRPLEAEASDEVEAGEEAVDENRELSLDDTVRVHAIIRNRDGFDTAVDTELAITAAFGTDWELIAQPESCEGDADLFTCALGDIKPSGPEHKTVLEFSLRPLRSGELSFQADIASKLEDRQANNDSDTIVFTVGDSAELAFLEGSLGAESRELTVGEVSTLTFSLSNAGPAIARDVSASLTMRAELLVMSTTDDNCATQGEFLCQYDSLDVDETRTVSVLVSASKAGIYNIDLSASTANQDPNSLDVSQESILVSVVEPIVEPSPDEGEDGAETDEIESAEEPDNTSNGNTDQQSQQVQVVERSSGTGSIGLALLTILVISIIIRMTLLLRLRPVSYIKTMH